MGKPIKLHLHKESPHVTENEDGERLVEAYCEQYYPAAKVVSVADYREWTEVKGYTPEIFCGHCRTALDS